MDSIASSYSGKTTDYLLGELKKYNTELVWIDNKLKTSITAAYRKELLERKPIVVERYDAAKKILTSRGYSVSGGSATKTSTTTTASTVKPVSSVNTIKPVSSTTSTIRPVTSTTSVSKVTTPVVAVPTAAPIVSDMPVKKGVNMKLVIAAIVAAGAYWYFVVRKKKAAAI
jgi:hypothetical protein